VEVSVVLDELDRGGHIVGIDTETASALNASGLVETRPTGAQGRWLLLPCGKVGAVRVGDHQVQVTPKERVGLARLIFLLGYARDPGFRPEDVGGIDEPELWPAFAESLTRQTEAALARGVLQGYRTVDESSRVLRGRVRLGDQIGRHAGLLMPIEVTYDDYTIDIAENRILRSALRRMLAVPRLRGQVRARLAHLDTRLDGSEVLYAGAPLPEWQASRLNARYQPALRLAELVLRNCSAEAGPGNQRVAAFVVSMWRVFEDFVTTAIAEALRGSPGRTTPQYPCFLDEPAPYSPTARLPMAVDLVHVVDGQPKAIFDAKYKVDDAFGRYPNADHYQMLAYCTALRVQTAWLVYAQGSSRPGRRRIRNTSIDIVDYPLNLAASPYDLLTQIDRLAASAMTESQLARLRVA
jgi:5-methylcytosine-specific restriction enzyme subunit McrC